MFKPIELDDGIAFPFYHRNPSVIIYYFTTCETLLEHRDKGTLPTLEPDLVRLVSNCPSSHLHTAMHNNDVALDRDTLTLKHLDTNGITWEVDADDPLSVVDGSTKEPVFSASFRELANNDIRVASAAKEAIYLLAGIYYRIRNRNQLDTMFDRDLLQQLLDILEKAGVENVQPFEYPYEAY